MHNSQDNSARTPFDIPAYQIFRKAAVELSTQVVSASEFKHALKNDVGLKQLRNSAREELKSIYDKVAKDLSLPDIPVYLPIRMKVSTRGVAFSECSSPTQIRIYPVEGISGVSRDAWKAKDIALCSKAKVFEILKHEIAHIMEAHRNSVMGDHDERFVKAYDEINCYFKENGFADLIDANLELWGCPPYSHAATIAAVRKPKAYSNSSQVSQGCFTMAVVFTLTVVSLFALL